MLSRLGVTNFKAFAQANIPLSRYTLLSGMNSAGKSTVLQALALLRQSHNMLGGQDGGGLLLNGDLVELGTARDVLHEEYVRPGEGHDPSGPTAHIALALDSDERTWTWTADYRLADSGADLLPIGPSTAPSAELPPELAGSRFQYLRADRSSPATNYPRSHEIAVVRGFLGAHGEHTVNYLRHSASQEVRDELHHLDAESQQLRDEVPAWMQDICPGVNLQAVALAGTDFVQLTFGFGQGGVGSTNRYRPTNVGFGLTYVLPVVVACLTAGPGSLLLIENPEAHLHPRGQTAMATLTALAAKAGAQVIVETHSDHVLNGLSIAVKNGILPAEDTAILFFRRPPGQLGADFVQPRLGSNGRLSEWPEGFFDEFERSMEKLLY
jgi:predicted ATPase